MAEHYQKSLDLFKEIYFKDDGNLDTNGYSKFGGDKAEYFNMAKNNFEGRSIIIGKSAFSPRIVQERVKINGGESCRYYLTLDPQGRFDHHFQLDEYPPEGFLQEELEAYQSKRRIDVTDMTQSEIMKKVSEILQMSNEEVMRTFNIGRTHSTNVKIGLIIDDVINEYLELLGSTEIEKVYGTERQMSTTTDNFDITQRIAGDGRKTVVKITQKGTDDSEKIVDSFSYDVLTPKEWDIEKIRIAINNGRPANSELGKLILKALSQRFTEKQQDDLTVEQTKTGAEQILDFKEAHGLTMHDLTAALAIALGTKHGVVEAENQIVNTHESIHENDEHTPTQ